MFKLHRWALVALLAAGVGFSGANSAMASHGHGGGGHSGGGSHHSGGGGVVHHHHSGGGIHYGGGYYNSGIRYYGTGIGIGLGSGYYGNGYYSNGYYGNGYNANGYYGGYSTPVYSTPVYTQPVSVSPVINTLPGAGLSSNVVVTNPPVDSSIVEPGIAMNSLPANAIPKPDNSQILIVNSDTSGTPVNYSLNQFQYTSKSGQRQMLTFDRPWLVQFDRGGNLGVARIPLSGGAWGFRVTDQGWDLVKLSDKAEVPAEVVPPSALPPGAAKAPAKTTPGTTLPAAPLPLQNTPTELPSTADKKDGPST